MVFRKQCAFSPTAEDRHNKSPAYFKDRSPVGRNYNHKWCHYGLRELARGIEDDDYNMFIERMGKPPLEFNLYAF